MGPFPGRDQRTRQGGAAKKEHPSPNSGPKLNAPGWTRWLRIGRPMPSQNSHRVQPGALSFGPLFGDGCSFFAAPPCRVLWSLPGKGPILCHGLHVLPPSVLLVCTVRGDEICADPIFLLL